LNNPPITKARSENYKPEIKEFFGLSMLVGISEAICLLPSSKVMKDLIFVILNYSIILENSLFIITKNLKEDISLTEGGISSEISIDNPLNKNSPSGKGKDDKFNE
jgi:hypothetical protein